MIDNPKRLGPCSKARLIDTSPLPAQGRLIRLYAPDLARASVPGQYVYVDYEGGSTPIPIVDAKPDQGWIVLLADVSRAKVLPDLRPNTVLTVRAPRGTSLQDEATNDGSAALLLGIDAGIAATLFLARRLAAPARCAVIGTRHVPPLRLQPSRFVVQGLPPDVIAGAAPFENLGIPTRVCVAEGAPGCFEGSALTLLEIWLRDLPPLAQESVSLFAAGPAKQLEQAEQRLAPFVKTFRFSPMP